MATPPTSPDLDADLAKIDEYLLDGCTRLEAWCLHFGIPTVEAYNQIKDQVPHSWQAHRRHVEFTGLYRKNFDIAQAYAKLFSIDPELLIEPFSTYL